MSEVIVTKQDLASADWVTLHEKFKYNTDRLSKFLRQAKGKLKIRGTDCDEFLRCCSLKIQKDARLLANNTAEFN